jgi:hypothetical protein
MFGQKVLCECGEHEPCYRAESTRHRRHRLAPAKNIPLTKNEGLGGLGGLSKIKRLIKKLSRLEDVEWLIKQNLHYNIKNDSQISRISENAFTRLTARERKVSESLCATTHNFIRCRATWHFFVRSARLS